ncbi:uncharacterized protein VTP21DRAFT_2937 [Calcarisporiella thermophila]|uniref:uncharacterized protein n=1 Tax=Calcarisporiella thermophila TaxID=911321 RepID=UPI0037436467
MLFETDIFWSGHGEEQQKPEEKEDIVTDLQEEQESDEPIAELPMELLSAIATEERRIAELRDELHYHEEQLHRLQVRWRRAIAQEERSRIAESSRTSMASRPSTTSRTSFSSVTSGESVQTEPERIQEMESGKAEVVDSSDAILQASHAVYDMTSRGIKELMGDISETEIFQSTRRKTLSLTRKFSSFTDEGFRSSRKKTLGFMEQMMRSTAEVFEVNSPSLFMLGRLVEEPTEDKSP